MKAVSKEQMAEMLNGNKYGNEITKEQEKLAKENNLLVLYGASDDLLEAMGAIYDEYEAWEGGSYVIIKKDEMYKDDEDEYTFHKAKENGLHHLSENYICETYYRLIRVEWCPEDNPKLSWRITSKLPYAKFIINEDEQPYCEGLVIDMDEVPNLE